MLSSWLRYHLVIYCSMSPFYGWEKWSYLSWHSRLSSPLIRKKHSWRAVGHSSGWSYSNTWHVAQRHHSYFPGIHGKLDPILSHLVFHARQSWNKWLKKIINWLKIYIKNNNLLKKSNALYKFPLQTPEISIRFQVG